MKATAYFVSDLHLFSRRSTALSYLPAMRRHARRAHTFVLGGDIFDFKWSTLASGDHTLDAAEQWLADLVDSAPRCRFHMLLGNHDHHECLMKRLRNLADQHENFDWDPYFLRLGDSLFLHGDGADGDATHKRLVMARMHYGDHSQRGTAANLAYDAVLTTQIHRTVPMMAYPNKRTARQLTSYLGDIGHGADTGIQHVYFGHTHRPLNAYEFEGLTFHNCGAPIRGVPFRIVEADVPDA